MSASSALVVGNETSQPEPSWQVAFVRPVVLQQYSGADTQLLNWPFLPPDPDLETGHTWTTESNGRRHCRCKDQTIFYGIEVWDVWHQLENHIYLHATYWDDET